MKYATFVLSLVLLVGCTPLRMPASEQESAKPPGPNLAAFRGLGRLAYTRDGRLYILDGWTEKEIPVTETGQAMSPAWAPDGPWLAYLWREGETGPTELRVVKSDGTDAHAIPGLPAVNTFAWSPAQDLIAASARDGGLWTMAPDSHANRVAPDQGSGFFAWAPDGKQLAYTSMQPTTTLPPTDLLWTISAGGGTPQKRLVDAQNGIAVVGWLPDGQGLLYWLMPAHSASLSADGVGLMLLDFKTGKPKALTTMLMRRDWISWSPDGTQFLVTVGGARMAWTGKSLAVCTVATAACSALDQPAGTVSEDGVWAPTGDRIAFVRGADLGGMGKAEEWLASRSLWVAAPDGSGAVELTAAGRGMSAPLWARDGHHLVYARDNALWLIDTEGGEPVKLAGPLLSGDAARTYYGNLPAPAAWYQP